MPTLLAPSRLSLFHSLPLIKPPHPPPNLSESITHLLLPCFYSLHTLTTSPQTKLFSTFAMASNNKRVIALILLVSLLLLAPSLEARMLRSEAKEKKTPSLEAGLLLGALPKGVAPPSSPSKGGHKTVTAGASKGNAQRLLGSVPSPGVGH